jgi:ankyrin repeat protein
VETVEVNHSPKDRWGSTPLNDAKKQEIKEYLESIKAERGIDAGYAEIPNMTVSDD